MKWHKFSDNLPPLGIPFLVYSPGQCVFSADANIGGEVVRPGFQEDTGEFNIMPYYCCGRPIYLEELIEDLFYWSLMDDLFLPVTHRKDNNER